MAAWWVRWEGGRTTIGNALRALSCSFWAGHQTYARYSSHSAIKAVLCHCQKTATGAKRLQHWLNPLLRHQLRDWPKSQEPMNIFSQTSIVFKYFPLLFPVWCWGRGGGEGQTQINSTARRQSSNFATARLDRCQSHTQAPKHICKVINILYSQQSEIFIHKALLRQFLVPFSPAHCNDNSMPAPATWPKGAKLARIVALSIWHLTPWQTPRQLCLAAFGSVMWLGCW